MTDKERNDIYAWFETEGIEIVDGLFVDPTDEHGWSPEELADLVFDYHKHKQK